MMIMFIINIDITAATAASSRELLLLLQLAKLSRLGNNNKVYISLTMVFIFALN